MVLRLSISCSNNRVHIPAIPGVSFDGVITIGKIPKGQSHNLIVGKIKEICS